MAHLPLRKLVVVMGLGILLVLLTACGGAAVEQGEAETTVRTPADIAENTVEFYHSEYCGCCDYHADAFVEYADAKEDLTLHVLTMDNTEIVNKKQAAGIPQELWSCHTAFMDGYFLEGHVPLSAVEWLLTERPEDVRGIVTQGNLDPQTWLGLSYYVVYTDGSVSDLLPAE
jgi:hypothetical protein